jgi:carbon storage regulator CsrA
MMLVLSRRPKETIRFPQLGISVSIVSVKGSRVQIGVDAPPEIQILRRELETDPDTCANTRTAGGGLPDKAKHAFRNWLNRATLGLHLAQKQLAAGQIESADKSLAMALERLSELESIAGSIDPKQSVELKSWVAGRKGEAIDTAHRPKGGDAPTCVDVLLVEDDQNEQALLRGLLEMEGYQVRTANNGNEAIACLERIRPRFVLLDMMMPDCDGRETFKRIRQMPAFESLPIFAVSGSSPDSVGLSIGSDGVDDWFPKPLNAPRLVQRMRDLIACLSS